MADIHDTIAELRRLHEAATLAPWQWWTEDGSAVNLSGPDELENHVLWCSVCNSCRERGADCSAPSKTNRDLIVAMRNALPALLDYIEELEARNGLDKT